MRIVPQADAKTNRGQRILPFDASKARRLPRITRRRQTTRNLAAWRVTPIPCGTWGQNLPNYSEPLLAEQRGK